MENPIKDTNQLCLQIGLETSMKRSNFTFGCVYLLYHKYHKIQFKQGGSQAPLIWSKEATKSSIKKKIINAFKTL